MEQLVVEMVRLNLLHGSSFLGRGRELRERRGGTVRDGSDFSSAPGQYDPCSRMSRLKIIDCQKSSVKGHAHYLTL